MLFTLYFVYVDIADSKIVRGFNDTGIYHFFVFLCLHFYFNYFCGEIKVLWVVKNLFCS